MDFRTGVVVEPRPFDDDDGLVENIAYIIQVEKEPVYFRRSVDDILRDADADGVERLLVLWEGTIPLFYYRSAIMAEFDRLAADGGLCRGHIIDRAAHARHYGLAPVDGFHLYPMTMLVDMGVWRRLGRPRFAGQGSIEMPGVERSAGDFHDGYTPHWIAPGSGTIEQEAVVGAPFIKASLDAGLIVHNVSAEVRSRTTHLYAHHRLPHLRRLVVDEARIPDDAALPRKYIDHVNACKDIYYGRGAIEPFRHFFVSNTEGQYLPSPDRFDCVITPCAGLKPFVIAAKTGTMASLHVHYDIAPTAVESFRFLVDAWDGTRSGLIEADTRLRERVPTVHGTASRAWDQLMTHFDTEDDVVAAWIRYRSKDHKYVVGNVLRDPETVIPKARRIYISLSNIASWAFIPQAFGMEEIRLKVIGILSRVRKQSEHAIVHLKHPVDSTNIIGTADEIEAIFSKDRFYESVRDIVVRL